MLAYLLCNTVGGRNKVPITILINFSNPFISKASIQIILHVFFVRAVQELAEECGVQLQNDRMDVELGSIEELEPNIRLKTRGMEDDLHFVIVDFLSLGIRGHHLRVFAFEGGTWKRCKKYCAREYVAVLMLGINRRLTPNPSTL
jgi:hypothetical protein